MDVSYPILFHLHTDRDIDSDTIQHLFQYPIPSYILGKRRGQVFEKVNTSNSKTSKPMKPNQPDKDQIYENPHELIFVPHVKDPGGQPRPPFNLILHHLLVQRSVPAGFTRWEPACYLDQEWLKWAPDYCYLVERYQLNMLLRYLQDLGVKDFKVLGPLVYASDYGCLSNAVMRRVMHLRNTLYNGGTVSEHTQKKAVDDLLDFIKATCGYHYSWKPEVIAEARARKADEDACLSITAWETRENPKKLTYLVHGKDRQGKRRPSMKRIAQCLDNKQMPPGFTPNRLFRVQQDMQWWLRFIPEYALLDCYNLKQLVEWLDALSLSVEDKMSVIYATDYGYVDHFMYTRTRDAVLAPWVTHRRAFLMAGFKKMPQEDIIACGPSASKSFRENFYRNRKP